MNWLDIGIFGVIGIGCLIGFSRGFILQLFGSVSFIASSVIGFLYMDGVGDWFVNQVGMQESYSPLVGFGLVFLGVHVCSRIVSRFLNKAVKKTIVFRGLNGVLGGALGLITWGLLISLSLYALNHIHLPPTELRNSSALYEVTYQFFPQTWDFVTQQYPEINGLIDRFRSSF